MSAMALCAIRYCIRRRTVSDGVRWGVSWARHYGRLSPWLRRIVIQDLEEIISQHHAHWGELDEREWRQVLADLRDMEAARAKR